MNRYDWNVIQEEYDSGLSFTELKQKHGMANATLVNAKRRGDLSTRSKSEAGRIAQSKKAVVSSIDWRNIQRAYDRGMSYRDIQKEFGVSSASVAKAVKRGDLTTRDISEARVAYRSRHGRDQGGVMGVEARERLSIAQSTANRGGRCRWYVVSGQKVQGTWERDLAEKFDAEGVSWRKPGLGNASDTFVYELDGKKHRYTPDFFLQEFDIYIELKGFWWGDDRRKMDAVYEQHPNIRLIVVEKEDFIAAIAA